MTRALLALVAMTMAAGLAPGQETVDTIEVAGAEALVKGDGPFQETLVRQDLDLGRFDRLLLLPTVFEFRDIKPARRSRPTSSRLRGDRSGPFGVRPEDRERYRNVVTEAFVAELGSGAALPVSEQPGPGVLAVRSAVLDIVSQVPGPYTGTANVHLSAVGEATVVFELVDASSGVVQARLAERCRIQPPERMFEVGGAPASSATVWSEIERWAHHRALALRRWLERERAAALLAASGFATRPQPSSAAPADGSLAFPGPSPSSVSPTGSWGFGSVG